MAEETVGYDTELDVLADVPIDDVEVTQGKLDSLLKAGGYTTDPENTTVRTAKSRAGRPYGKTWGAISGPEEGHFGFAFSWVRVNRVIDGVDTGKPDTMFKNYCRLVDLYETAFEEKPKKVMDLFRLIQGYPLRLRITQFNGDNFVANISLPREGA